MTCKHPTLQRADDGRCCDCDVMVGQRVHDDDDRSYGPQARALRDVWPTVQERGAIALVPSWLAMRDALYSILNVEGAALSGSSLGAHEGLDTTYHFDKVRAALALAEKEN